MVRSPPALAIRPYEPRDDDFIASLGREAFEEFTPSAALHTLALVRRCTTLVALERLGDFAGGLRGLAAGRRGAPSPAGVVRQQRVGFAALAEEGGPGVLHLSAIAVVHGERGRGIGHELMLASERLALRRGARRLELCTADCNLAALDLFQRHGFVLLRRRERFYARGQDACVLGKELRGVR